MPVVRRWMTRSMRSGNLSIIEERLNEMKRVGEEGGRRHWAIVPSLIGALLGGVLTFLGQLAIRHWYP